MQQRETETAGEKEKTTGAQDGSPPTQATQGLAGKRAVTAQPGGDERRADAREAHAPEPGRERGRGSERRRAPGGGVGPTRQETTATTGGVGPSRQETTATAGGVGPTTATTGGVGPSRRETGAATGTKARASATDQRPAARRVPAARPGWHDRQPAHASAGGTGARIPAGANAPAAGIRQAVRPC